MYPFHPFVGFCPLKRPRSIFVRIKSQLVEQQCRCRGDPESNSPQGDLFIYLFILPGPMAEASEMGLVKIPLVVAPGLKPEDQQTLLGAGTGRVISRHG